jgi:non-ribosomal peptide synthetase component F
MALLSGATLVIAEPERLRPGTDLAATIAEQRITHLTLPPSALAVLPDGALPAGVTIVVAGEACSRRLAQRWSHGRRMINAYGPTETTVCATMSDPLSGDDEPPIGRPVPGTAVYVLDEPLDPVPPGERGELYVAGPAVALGYLDKPDLTGQRFLPDPFGPPGSHVSHRRPRSIASGRTAGVPGAGRRPGEGPRLPGGAGRGPVGATDPFSGAAGRRDLPGRAGRSSREADRVSGAGARSDLE